jgi:hypothetical protein
MKLLRLVRFVRLFLKWTVFGKIRHCGVDKKEKNNDVFLHRKHVMLSVCYDISEFLEAAK